MSTTIIGAEAAKLAGLQIDLLGKYRAGQLSLDHCERFLNLTSEAREERFGDWTRPVPATPVTHTAPVVKFGLLADLGIIVVPEGYDHATRLAEFKIRHQVGCNKSFYSYDAITDATFSNPTRILKPGDKLWVRIYQQFVGGMTTSEERLKFLATLNSHLVGAQGATMVFDQKRDLLPKGKWYASMDEKERLWLDAGGYHRVPEVHARTGGGFSFDLGLFEDLRSDYCAVLSFCDVPSST